ncbi:hypothetical protein [Actinosynnema mirum]|uniref:Uncharacterized protein n=1 Tax=Actinosynnema mirum (strain ATCC 29888 / DSM 43827 / JCM 3225 / NBRC 14064 / NCIMB 13271 / NRRL B-12336 / IMRU 3971 / 101) TaxID=446462 RepID=C6WLL9_ACTMD|nr:hypothetical protein [Actinosynnema mirum]ACU38412.1 hypothetical protein Amir_4574 [Actinosynnema mirum DSM 43827]
MTITVLPHDRPSSGSGAPPRTWQPLTEVDLFAPSQIQHAPDPEHDQAQARVETPVLPPHRPIGWAGLLRAAVAHRHVDRTGALLLLADAGTHRDEHDDGAHREEDSAHQVVDGDRIYAVRLLRAHLEADLRRVALEPGPHPTLPPRVRALLVELTACTGCAPRCSGCAQPLLRAELLDPGPTRAPERAAAVSDTGVGVGAGVVSGRVAS